MLRRSFLRTMVGGVAVGAAVRTFPFRVFSFPTEIKIAHWYDDWSNFDIAKVVPVHLDPELARKVSFATSCSIISWNNSFLSEKAIDLAIANEGNQI